MDTPSDLNTPDQPQSEPDAKQIAERRKKRRDKVIKANRVTLDLNPAVRRYLTAQAKAAGTTLSLFLNRLAEQHIVATAGDTDPLGQKLKGRHAVFDRIEKIARDMDGDGKFDEHFILTVMRAASTDVGFMAQYQAAAGGDTAEGEAEEKSKSALNQQLARVIQLAVQAKAKRGEDGKVVRADAEGALMTSYSLVERPDG